MAASCCVENKASFKPVIYEIFFSARYCLVFTDRFWNLLYFWKNIYSKNCTILHLIWFDLNWFDLIWFDLIGGSQPKRFIPLSINCWNIVSISLKIICIYLILAVEGLFKILPSLEKIHLYLIFFPGTSCVLSCLFLGFCLGWLN